MKYDNILTLAYLGLLSFGLQAQMVVSDPANTKMNTLIHIAEQAALELSEKQGKRIKEQLELAQRYEELLQSVPDWLWDSPKLKALYETERQILKLYGQGLQQLTQQKGLSRKERTDILTMYSGILKKTTAAMGQLQLILVPGPEHSFTHGERLNYLDGVLDELEHCLVLMHTWHRQVRGYLQEKQPQNPF